jgi:hypothetical protein
MDQIGGGERAFKALALARRHYLTIDTAAAKVGVSQDEVLEYTGDAWEWRGGDRWTAKRRDNLHREMQVITEVGPEWVDTYDSRIASRIGQQTSAVGHYLRTGDPSRLRPFAFRVGGRTVRLASDPETIDRLAAGGEIHLEVYRR